MGKSKKRRHEREEELEELRKKVSKLEKMLENGPKSADQCNLENMAANGQEPPVQNTQTTEEERNSTSAQPEQIVSDSEIQEGDEKQIQDNEWLDILGDDPTENEASETKMDADLLKRWEFFCKQGMKEEALDSLIKRYKGATELAPPKLNAQISVTMKNFAIVRDKHMVEVQNMASVAMSIIGSVITMMYEGGDEGLDFGNISRPLSDAGRILAALMHKQNVTRKAFIEPGLLKEVRTILKDTKVDEFLYGKELTEKLKEAKAMSKLGETLKPPQPKNADYSRKNLNPKAPFVNRPGQMGSSSFTGHPKRKVFFKNKQQFSNQKAQAPSQKPYQAPQNKMQEKKE